MVKDLSCCDKDIGWTTYRFESNSKVYVEVGSICDVVQDVLSEVLAMSGMVVMKV